MHFFFTCVQTCRFVSGYIRMASIRVSLCRRRESTRRVNEMSRDAFRICRVEKKKVGAVFFFARTGPRGTPGPAPAPRGRSSFFFSRAACGMIHPREAFPLESVFRMMAIVPVAGHRATFSPNQPTNLTIVYCTRECEPCCAI